MQRTLKAKSKYRCLKYRRQWKGKKTKKAQPLENQKRK